MPTILCMKEFWWLGKIQNFTISEFEHKIIFMAQKTYTEFRELSCVRLKYTWLKNRYSFVFDLIVYIQSSSHISDIVFVFFFSSGIENNNECFCGFDSDDYTKYGRSKNCRENGRGEYHAINIYTTSWNISQKKMDNIIQVINTNRWFVDKYIFFLVAKTK